MLGGFDDVGCFTLGFLRLFAVVLKDRIVFSVFRRGDIEVFFKQRVEMAGGFKIQLVRDLHQGHIREGKQVLCVLQLGAVDVLRNRAMHVLFKNTRQLRIAVGQGLLRCLDLLTGNQRVI